jgi:1-phosphofructokinase family hexose kinase
MIITVTPNTGLDHVLFLDRLRPGRRNQALASVVCMGGKGTDVSLILGQMGVTSLATGFAAGETGARMRRMLEDAGVETAFLPVAGETRVNTVLFEAETGTHTTICAEGLRATPADLDALAATLSRRTHPGDVVVYAGSLPDGIPADAYASLIRASHERGARTILDSSGAFLAAAIPAQPWAVKPNRDELEGLAGRPVTGLAEAIAAARELLAAGVTWVFASLGAAGAVAVASGEAWVADPFPVRVVNPAGAGDAVVAQMALGIEHGWDLARALREAVAAATAVVVTPGTAECDVSRLGEFRKRVVVRPWTEG